MKKPNGIWAALALATLAVAPAFSESEDMRWYGVEEGTVVREVSGGQQGHITEHWKQWGQVRVEIQDLTITMFGMNRQVRQTSIVEGANVTTIDYVSGRVSQARNPLLDGLNQGESKDGVATGEAMYRAMGGEQTDEMGEYANELCRIWRMSSMGQTSCVTKDGISVYDKVDAMGMSSTRVATRVERGNPGPASAYLVPDDLAPAEQVPGLQGVPDMGAVLEALQGLGKKKQNDGD